MLDKLTRNLARAERIEDSIRERAFLPLGEIINGVKVLQFTLRHLTICFRIRSPFLYGGVRQIEDVGVFLWVVSPDYDPQNNTRRAEFLADLILHPKWELFYRAIDRYIERAFMDSPPSHSGGKRIPASYAAGMIHRIATVYGWRRDEILETPIAALFQLLKWIAVERDPSAPQFSPMQDRIKARMINGR